ncbi:MAG: PhoH family protein [Bacteroidales bacterium]|nr:PhoH family protein [Bacteroidales bacterium]
MSTILNKTITLDAIDPIEILGVNNKLFDQFKSYFPQLKATSRGNEIMLVGSDDAIALFETKLQQLIQKRMGKMSLNSYDVESLFEGSDSSKEIGKVDMMSGSDYIIVYGVDGKCVKARTVNQKRLVKEYYDNDLIFALGPAGTGKTYTAIALAVRALKNREVKRLILTRPAVEAGERLGFLPGDLKEKLDPYLQPLYDALQDMIPAKKLQSLMEDGTIQIAPLAYMRGRTLDKAFVILDEAQNTSLSQLKMFLTRMGNDAKFIVTGDATQIDLPHKDDSGLLKGVEMVRSIRGISVVNFTKEDIVRHPLVTKIIEAFDRKEASEKQD